MRRREFISLVGGAAACWPLAARAQQAGNLPTIGFLGTDATAWSAWTAAFVQRLHELGWIEGCTVAIEYLWDEGVPERQAEFAAEFVRRKVDVIVTNGGSAHALKQTKTGIPIVFALDLDPLGDGLVDSLARPGGNVTGVSLQQADYAGKRLELLRQIVPNLHRLAILFSAGTATSSSEAVDVQAMARRLGLEVAPLEIRRAEDIAPAFASLQAPADALYIAPDSLVAANRTRIITFALTARLPTIFTTRDYVQAGALLSYGPNFSDLFRRVAEFVDKILHGTKPGDIPVEQPTKFYLTINVTTAKALGITIPADLLALADEVIE